MKCNSLVYCKVNTYAYYIKMSTATKYTFYIPRIYGNYTVADIIATFRLLYIGEVSRVDINEKNDDYMTAFIHMDHLYDTEIAWQVINTTYNEKCSYKLWLEPDCYWLILKNTNPVAETHLNIHQIAENARLLEEKVKTSEDKIDRLEYVIHKLCRRIYDKDYEMQIVYDTHNFMHYNQHYSEGYLSINAETRVQQIAQYKQEIAEMKREEPWDEYVHKYTSHIMFSPQSSDTEDGEDSDSDTHPSMPDLLPCANNISDSDTHPSMPDLLPGTNAGEDGSIDEYSVYESSSSDSDRVRAKPGKRRKYRRGVH